ncbi:hypothetical protein J6590_034540 [Homalodisca vitripennis]|nr:hypothetical protein J6590_034540 [Homalodisca vitripennis]
MDGYNGFCKLSFLQESNQHGFLKERSTNTAIISLVVHIIEQIDKKQYISGLFLDYILTSAPPHTGLTLNPRHKVPSGVSPWPDTFYPFKNDFPYYIKSLLITCITHADDTTLILNSNAA